MDLAQKVDVLVQTVNGLVTVNERLVGLLTEAFVLAKRSEGARRRLRLGMKAKAMSHRVVSKRSDLCVALSITEMTVKSCSNVF